MPTSHRQPTSHLCRVMEGLTGMLVLTCSLWAQDAYMDRLEKAIDFYAQKSYSEAAAYLATLAEANPDRKEAFLWLGHAREQLRDWNASRDAYKRYSELDPKDIEGPKGVARTYEAESKTDLARVWYLKARDLEPGNGQVKDALARLGAESESPVPSAASNGAGDQLVKSTEGTAGSGFWQTGLVGLVGGRSAWWARLIAVFLFSGSIVNGASMTGKYIAERMPNLPSAFYLLQALVGTPLTYILWWGLPNGTWNWVLMGVCVLVAMSASSFGAKQAR